MVSIDEPHSVGIFHDFYHHISSYLSMLMTSTHGLSHNDSLSSRCNIGNLITIS